jgi:uncharacterized membrane protein YgcG/predicted  nucleic acid-binding Zn-ribbon protein
MSILTAGLARVARTAAAATLLALPLAATTLSVDISPASAAVTCAAPVIDNADLLDDNRISSIAGADVHVITFTSVPSGDIDGAVFAQRDECSNWQGATGGWGSNDIVFAMSLNDRLSGVYYGPTFEDALGQGRWESARTAMGPYFADGDFTEGINAGIKRTQYLIDNPNVNTNPNPTVSEPSEPLDIPWAWILGVPAGGAVLAGGGFGAMRARKRLIERNQYRAEATTLTNKAADLFVELEPLDELTTSRVEGLPDNDDDGILDIRDLSAKTTAKTSTVVNAYLAHMEQWSESAIRKTNLLTAKQAADSAQQVHDGLRQALTSNQTLEQSLNDLETRNAQTPAVLDKAEQTAAKAVEALNSLSDEGYAVTEYRARLLASVKAMEGVRAQHAENLWGEAASAAATLAARIDAVHEEATDLRARRARIEDKVSALSTRHADLSAAQATGKGDLAALVGAFHASCVNETSDQFTDGETAHTKAAENIEQARIAVGMDQQRFDDAEQALGQAESLLDTADDAFTAPARQHEYLTDLAGSLSGLVDAAESEIAAVASKMSNNREAMKFLDRKPNLDALRSSVQTVAGELAAERPTYLSLSRDIDAVRADIRNAAQQVEGIIREYAEAQQAIARAERAVRDAQSKSSRSHAGSRSKSLANDAERNLREATNAMTLAMIISNANSAVSSASAAESAAQSAINSYNASQSSSSYSSGGGGGGSWSGGGGSGSWGGGGGGSSDGGGGSGGW